MQAIKTTLPGVVLLTPKVFGDERGFFMETFNQAKAQSLGLPRDFVQDNHSKSSYGVLRGLHLQYPLWQGKLVRAIQGEIFDVAVDVRTDSATFGQWYGAYLSAENKQQLYIPEGFAHGFCVTSETAEVVYKCTAQYQPQDEVSLAYNDPQVGIQWPVKSPILSEKDKNAVSLAQLPTLKV